MSKPNINPTLYKLDPEQMRGVERSTPVNPILLPQLTKEFNRFEHINKTDNPHIEILRDLFPKYLTSSCHETDWQLFTSMSRYDRRHKTFVVGCFKNEVFDFTLISYKWRYKDNVKWKTRAGTSPNSTLLIRIFTDNEPIYVIEGHRDSLTSILLGLDFIMIPYAGFKLKNPTELQHEVTNRHLVFIVEDEPAYKCMVKVAEHVKETADSIQFIELSDTDEKVDLSDYVQQFNNIQEVIDGLRNRR